MLLNWCLTFTNYVSTWFITFFGHYVGKKGGGGLWHTQLLSSFHPQPSPAGGWAKANILQHPYCWQQYRFCRERKVVKRSERYKHYQRLCPHLGSNRGLQISSLACYALHHRGFNGLLVSTPGCVQTQSAGQWQLTGRRHCTMTNAKARAKLKPTFCSIHTAGNSTDFAEKARW